MKPLFMWAGGKSKLIKHYNPHLPETFDSNLFLEQGLCLSGLIIKIQMLLLF